MQASVEAVVIVTPKPDPVSPSPEEMSDNHTDAPSAAQSTAPGPIRDSLVEMTKRLEEILHTYGSAASLLDKQTVVMEPMKEKMEESSSDDVNVTTDTDTTAIMQDLDKLSSPDEKVKALVRMYVELAEARHVDERKLCVLQQKLSCLSRDQEELQAECHRGLLARRDLEELCRELQQHNRTLKEETLWRCREDEEKRNEITSHFQITLAEIQAQIEQHSSRNTKLHQENTYLADKLNSLMSQYEQREESLEKLDKHRELQQKLSDAKLEQANALLAEALEKHKREKEYLLREAIDKTKKCYAMKQQELAMKKKLTLYSQKFDDFQITLAKSNDIFVTFKQEMEKMSKKMKTLEKESGIWKTRFESCNKALTDMIKERSEKGKEFDLFVLKIQKLEKLCRTLQDERKCLYEKIKEIRGVDSGLSSKLPAGEALFQEDAPESPLTAPAECPEVADPVLTENMVRLRAEQARLQEFAASLLNPSADSDDDGSDPDQAEDVLSSALVQFTQQTPLTVEPREVPAPEQVENKQVTDPVSTAPEEPLDAKPVPSEQLKAEMVPHQGAGAASMPDEQNKEEGSHQPSEEAPASEPVEADSPTDPKPSPAEGEAATEVTEAIHSIAPLEAPQQNPNPTSCSIPVEPERDTSSTSTPPEASTPQLPASTESSKKQSTKKKNIKKAS